MKRNFIAYLQEYGAKTISNQKEGKNKSKCIKTIYNIDKENINPNILNQSARKKNTKIKVQSLNNSKKIKSKQSEKSPIQSEQKVQMAEQSLLPSTPIAHNGHFERSDEFYDFKLKCVKIQRLLTQKELQQKNKCQKYYDWIREQVNRQQENILSVIKQYYSSAKSRIQQLVSQVEYEVRCFQLDQKIEVDLQLLEIVIDDSLKQKIHHQVECFNIFNLQKVKSVSSSISNSGEKIDFLCSEEDFQKRKFKDISFFDQNLIKKSSFSPVEEATESEEGISPTFKQF